MSIRKEDLYDLDIKDAYELASDGYSVFLPNITCMSTSVTKIVTISGIDLLYERDNPVESGDRIQIVGSTGADGYYTIDQILSASTFSVVSTMVNSTGGLVSFMYPSGASSVGFDPTGLPTSATNLQDVIADLIGAPSGFNLEIDGVPAGSVNTLNVLTPGLNITVGGNTATLSLNSDDFILEVNGSIVYVNDGIFITKV